MRTVSRHLLHPPSGAIAFWSPLIRSAAGTSPTPFYLFSVEPIRAALDELRVLEGGLPVRHWLSCKTQPLRPLLRWWRREGRGIEVVSEFEFLAARREGFAPEQILVNGPATHHWLPRHAVRGLAVNFDSLRSIDALLPLARKLDWRVGVRCLTREEFDPENPEYPTQFGLAPREAVAALRRLRHSGVRLEIIHFHLRTNVSTPGSYGRAIDEVADLCQAARFAPRYLDFGGGLPPPHTYSRAGREFATGFDLAGFAAVLRRGAGQFPGLQELWLENGRFVSARSGVLVVRVLDVKMRRGLRQLICDGGRTMNALVSNWETHRIFTLPERGGPIGPTAVHGPTCMAFDQLTRGRLSRNIRVGDLLAWMEAGAYHLPWETRFSHGLATVFWHENGKLAVARPRETFDAWWGQWDFRSASKSTDEMIAPVQEGKQVRSS